MIKEKPKVTKYNIKKTRNQVLLEYARTVMLSFIVAVFITTGLSIHARNEMIKNLYASADSKKNLDKVMAQQFINSHTGLLDDLKTKKYSICMNVAKLYETAGEYPTAQVAYEFAMEKAKPDIFNAHYSLICTLLEQNKFDEAEKIVNNVHDYNSKNLLKFKSRAYIVIGDKYYSIGKFISASKNYEKAGFYYNKFTKKQDKTVVESINNRILNSYIQSADALVKMGKNSEAVSFLKKAEKMKPNDLKIKYKLAIILSDLDPEKSVEYLEVLLDKAPQDIDYEIFGRALMKAANIADLDGRPTKSKYYRYKIHSIDMFINRKVVYKNDLEVIIDSNPVKKAFFTYPINLNYYFLNNSNIDITYLKADFSLCNKGEEIERVTEFVANKEKPLYSGMGEPNKIEIKFRKRVLSKKDLEDYTVKIYVYKDEKFKTLAAETKIPIR